jgi:hypothetical protein
LASLNHFTVPKAIATSSMIGGVPAAAAVVGYIQRIRISVLSRIRPVLLGRYAQPLSPQRRWAEGYWRRRASQEISAIRPPPLIRPPRLIRPLLTPAPGPFRSRIRYCTPAQKTEAARRAPGRSDASVDRRKRAPERPSGRGGASAIDPHFSAQAAGNRASLRLP